MSATAEDAAAAVQRLTGIAGMRACAILDGRGELLAASEDNDWAAQAARIWDAAAEPGRPAPAHVHVGIEGGEVFAVRGTDAAIVAIADRFTLGSLMLCDLRDALRAIEPA
ncbi:MAG TPA: hypothetical protein VFH44_06160 [Solirubrobacterales bacterium]|nr:hypothetical protein [Solirubrobacterales bacterium]